MREASRMTGAFRRSDDRVGIAAHGGGESMVRLRIGALVASAVADLTLHIVCATASWFQYRDLMIDRRSVTLLLGAAAVLPAAFFADIEPLTRGLVATALVLSGAIIGVTGEEWGSLSRRVIGRLPSRFARAT